MGRGNKCITFPWPFFTVQGTKEQRKKKLENERDQKIQQKIPLLGKSLTKSPIWISTKMCGKEIR